MQESDSRIFTIYLLTNKSRTVFYCGRTGNLAKRLIYHYFTWKYKLKNTFVAQYNVIYLVYFEEVIGFKNSLRREALVKKMSRALKRKMIEKENPDYSFLNNTITDWPPSEELLERVKQENL